MNNISAEIRKGSMFYSDREYYGNIQEYILECCRHHKNKVMCKYLVSGEVVTKTYGDMLVLLTAIGSYLRKVNNSKLHVALLGRTSFEWIAAYLGSLCYGVVVVPLDKALPENEILKYFEFSDASVLIFDPEYSDVAKYIKDNARSCKKAISLSDSSSEEFENLTDVISQGDVIEPIVSDANDIAEIVFTSGTTGVGKGVMLSYKNIASAVMFGIRLVDFSSDDSVLSIMPNNHTYELSVGIMTPMYFGMSIAINDSLKRFKQSFLKFKPSTMIVVPALLNMLRNQILGEVKKKGHSKKFKAALIVTRALKTVGIDIRRKVFSDVIEGLGGNLKSLICGGAFLSDDLLKFYDNIGINIIQGYGITECSPIVSCNTDRKSRKLGEVGPYCEVKCIDGELCVRGDNVMLGYYKDKEGTDKVLIDGWFHTGDIGAVDSKNCVSLSGRVKNLIINSNGENISPEEIENHLAFIDLIANAVVYGEDDLIAVEIYPNFNYAKENNIEDIEKELQIIVDKINSEMPRKMHIERIHIRNKPFDMTTTMKIKRHLIR